MDIMLVSKQSWRVWFLKANKPLVSDLERKACYTLLFNLISTPQTDDGSMYLSRQRTTLEYCPSTKEQRRTNAVAVALAARM